MSTETAPRTYGNWGKPRSAGLFGLGSIGTGILLGGLMFSVIVVMVRGLLEGLVVGAIVGVVLLAVLTKDSHGKNVVDRIVARTGWWAARSRGANVYRSGPLGATPWGTHQLPGLAAPIRLTEHVDSYRRPFAMLYTPATASYSVVIATEPDGAALVDTEQIDSWVADWGLWLSNLGDEVGLMAASVTVETAPDSGARLRREVTMHMDPNAHQLTREMLQQVVQEYPASSSTVRAFVTLTFKAGTRPGGKRREAPEVASDLAARLPVFTRTLQSTGAGAASPLDAAGLCEVVRVAYDPAAASMIDDAHALGESVDLDWTDVGPSAAEATWDAYAHDSGYSRTWAMTVAPRGTVQSGILAKLLAPHPDVARKRVTMLYRPIDSARAAALVEADLRAAEFRVSSTNKPAARESLAMRAAAATASEEASGAGLVQFGMLVTATVTDSADAADASAAVMNLGAAARLKLRPVYGSQDSAFAAALPLGLVLPKHLKLPAEMRGGL